MGLSLYLYALNFRVQNFRVKVAKLYLLYGKEKNL
nr:hypothetical protein JMPHXYHW_JMPHXYHW_CDS_0019 [uncultured phage]